MESFSILPVTYLANIVFNPISNEAVAGIIISLVLLLISALVSGSEVAFFSLISKQLSVLKEGESTRNLRIIGLLKKPDHLLASILIANSLLNVAIVIVGSYTTSLIVHADNKWIDWLLQIAIITFLIILFAEVLPKFFANQKINWFVSVMSIPMVFLTVIFRPFSEILIRSTFKVKKKSLMKKQNISFNELSDALDLTDNEIIEEKKILQGIVCFGNLEVQEIMKPRIDITAIEMNDGYDNLKKLIIESGYSRIPVYEETIDDIKGVLYVKDILPFIHENNSFQWFKLIRKPYFVPESKKINDLLQEFQNEKVHLALVIDEYGGAAGLITLEDILEEIVGEIKDESDEDEETQYLKISENKYLVEGKILINDFVKLFDIDNDYFDLVRGEADTLAGVILELGGRIPVKNDQFNFRQFTFLIESVDNRRIKKILVEIDQETANRSDR